MLSCDELLKKHQTKALSHPALWRSIPTCFPTKSLFWPETLSTDEQNFAAALADATADVDQSVPQKDRWYQYGSNENTEFCFGAIKPQVSRFTDGSFPVWYGASSQEASKAEITYHLTRQAAHEMQFAKSESSIRFERAMCKSEVHMAPGLDLRDVARAGHKGLLENGPRYAFCQKLGVAAHAKGIQGLASISARMTNAENWAVFHKDAVLSSIVKNFWDLEVSNNGERRICGVLLNNSRKEDDHRFHFQDDH